VSDQSFESVVGRAAFDESFAKALAADPAAALQSIGVEPTDELLEALGTIDAGSLINLAKAFEPQPGVC
jgi:hypothetical protein